MIGISFVSISYGKVVHNQGKMDWPGVMHPQARRDGAWVVAVWFQKGLELSVGQFASLW